MAASDKVPTLAGVGEFGFLRRLLPSLPTGPNVTVGAGDDCAVVRTSARSLLLTTDALVERVHFERAWLSPGQLGRKAYLVNASDVAAMGGRPRYCLMSVGAPPDFPVRDLRRIHAGAADAATETGAVLVGGNLTRADRLFLSVALVGDAPERPVRRSGARPGDLLFVTGTLGDAAFGLGVLRREPDARGPAVRRFREPRPRLRAGRLLASHGIASAMIDVSDGLVQDLAHLCRASGVGAEIEAGAIPCAPRLRRTAFDLVLGGGEDYELLCSVSPRRLARLERVAGRLGCPLTRIGRVVRGRSVRVVDEGGRPLAAGPSGFDHFAAEARA